jgi:hypothetical protein
MPRPIKYAALTSSFELDGISRIPFDDNTYLARVDAPAVFKHERVSHWSKWLGELAMNVSLRQACVTSPHNRRYA